MTQVSLISPDQVDKAWPVILEVLDKIPDMPQMSHNLLKSLRDGKRRAIICWTEDGVEAVAIIQVSLKPVRQLLVWAMAGEDRDNWEDDLESTLLMIAKELQLPRIRGYGRRGWARALKKRGWQEVSTVVELEVDNNG